MGLDIYFLLEIWDEEKQKEYGLTNDCSILVYHKIECREHPQPLKAVFKKSMLCENIKYDKIRRIENDINMATEHLPIGTSIKQIIADKHHYQVTIDGSLALQNTPYEKGVFYVHLFLDPKWPFEQPNINFVTKILHPNISPCGIICSQFMCANGWYPYITIGCILYNLIKLLRTPHPPLDVKDFNLASGYCLIWAALNNCYKFPPIPDAYRCYSRETKKIIIYLLWANKYPVSILYKLPKSLLFMCMEFIVPVLNQPISLPLITRLD